MAEAKRWVLWTQEDHEKRLDMTFTERWFLQMFRGNFSSSCGWGSTSGQQHWYVNRGDCSEAHIVILATGTGKRAAGQAL